MKKLFLIALLFFCIPSFAFEIKPEFVNSFDWNENPRLLQETDSSCNDSSYKKNNTVPVHEIITSEATKRLCWQYQREKNGKSNFDRLEGIFANISEYDEHECKSLIGHSDKYSSNDPLISGSEFNDDPTGILRRDRWGWQVIFDWIQAKDFENIG